MAAKDAFDPYEYIGVIAPGTALVFGCIWVFQEDFGELFELKDIDLGELGVFVLLAFVAGHVVQGLGNGLEKLIWGRKGMPTDRLFEEDQEVLTAGQIERLRKKLSPGDQPARLSDFTKAERSALVREMYVAVHSGDRAMRIDAFNRTYGLLRGIASAFLLTALLVAIASAGWPRPVASLDWKSILVLTTLALIALVRMKRFGRNYARELLIEYISL